MPGANEAAAEHIGVIVRLRPLSKQEKGLKTGTAVRKHGDQALVIEDVPRLIRCTLAFDEHADQLTFFQRCGVTSLLESVLQGYRATAFAYGQTGSGKTYTMFGGGASRIGGASSELDGMLPRSLDYIFARMAQLAGSHRFRARVTCLEIHREVVRDLFAGSATTAPSSATSDRPLHVREHPTFGFFVEGLRVVGCPSAAKAWSAVVAAVARRRVGAHKVNDRSSRSHAIITLYIDTQPLGGGAAAGAAAAAATTTTYGAMSFVDLAGSERPKRTESSGIMLQDAAHINKSLYTLGHVIAGLERLAQRPSLATTTTQVIPYRDSQLTKLLISSLGGHCKTLMVGCCSTAGGDAVGETLRTLEFAGRVRGIKNLPRVQHNPHRALIDRLRDEIATLKKENETLRRQLHTAASASSASATLGQHIAHLDGGGGGGGSDDDPGFFGDAYNTTSPDDSDHDAGEETASADEAYSMLMSSFSRANISLPSLDPARGRGAAGRFTGESPASRTKAARRQQHARRRKKPRSPKRVPNVATSRSLPAIVPPLSDRSDDDDDDDDARELELSAVFARALTWGETLDTCPMSS